MQMYEVGGCVRDELLGVPSKDIDFTVVLGEQEGIGHDPFEWMESELTLMGFKIFLSTPEFLTVRAQFPRAQAQAGRRAGLTADFVLARKESDYTDGRRPDAVVPGTLEDDLARRDFTMNAIAKAPDGTLIDPFEGQVDIRRRMIVAVGDPIDRFTEDALRAVRALRFSVTKDFGIANDVQFAMETVGILDAIRDKISDERIQIELSKMFRFNTVASLRALNRFPNLTDAMFAGSVSLDATMKQRGRGK